MKVRELMACHVKTVDSSASIQDAAVLMADRDVGVVPVVENGRLVGLVTDRDILVREVADGLRRDARVCSIMTERVFTCAPDDEVEVALAIMADQQVRRVPVVSGDGRLVGIFSLGDAARTEEYQEAAAATLANICRPHGRHCQKRHAA